MRTIYVTGGRADYAKVTVTDANGASLSTATIRLGLSATDQAQPTVWYAPSVTTYPTPGTAVLSLLLTETNAPAGSHRIWADVVDSPTSQPVLATNDVIRTI